MRRLLRKLWRHKLLTLIGVAALVILFSAWRTQVDANTAKIRQAQLVAAQNACNLDPQTFLNTVNEWRAAAHVQPLRYSTQLQQAAQARVADMQQYQYYGHMNPQTKQDNGYFTQKYDPAATWWDEVLDGPNNAGQASADFKNSSAHFTALTSPKTNYIGLASVYTNESWGVYDNSGKLQDNPGTYHSSCTVVGQLADKIGLAPMAPSDIVSAINQIRASHGLSAFNWITQLDSAAQARANYMVANGTTSLSVGNPGADITNANYYYSSWQASDTWDYTSVQQVAQALSSGSDAGFGLSTTYSDIGIAVVNDTINNSPTQLVMAYIANSAPSPRNSPAAACFFLDVMCP